MKEISLFPIGYVRSSRKVAEDDNWDKETARIELDPQQFKPDALCGIEDFSHVEIIFFMDQVDPAKVETGARHPRGNPSWPKVGIFAQRAKNRPNRIGLSVCGIKKIEGLTLHLEGLDAVDGTPVLDIKPWIDEFSPRGGVFQPKWITELMKDYW